PVEVGEELVVEHRGGAERVHRTGPHRPRRRVRALAADLEHRRDGAEPGPAGEDVAGEGAGDVAADVRSPGGEAAYRGRLGGPERPLEADPLAGLVAGPDPGQDALRAYGGGAED